MKASGGKPAPLPFTLTWFAHLLSGPALACGSEGCGVQAGAPCLPRLVDDSCSLPAAEQLVPRTHSPASAKRASLPVRSRTPLCMSVSGDSGGLAAFSFTGCPSASEHHGLGCESEGSVSEPMFKAAYPQVQVQTELLAFSQGGNSRVVLRQKPLVFFKSGEGPILLNHCFLSVH